MTFISYCSCTGHTSVFIFCSVLVYNGASKWGSKSEPHSPDTALDYRTWCRQCMGQLAQGREKEPPKFSAGVAHFFRYFRCQRCVCVYVHTHMGHTRDSKTAQKLSLCCFICSCSGDLSCSSNPSLTGRLAWAGRFPPGCTTWSERCTCFHALTPLPSRRDSALRQSSADSGADPLQNPSSHSHFTARKPK